MLQPTVSVVIPTWCEAEWIADTVRCCRSVADEVIVSDGGSPDATAAHARAAGATVIEAPKGRGAQLNAGARVALGDVLWFVHADVQLPAQSRAAVSSALADPSVIGGNFKLRFQPSTWVSSLYSGGNNVRRRVFGIYYGDSCIFVRRSAFIELGGFSNQPLFEDYDFARRLERHGKTAYVSEVAVRVSARRFVQRPVRTLALWALLQTAYSFGVPAERLCALYSAVR